jgi:hypothetical protein
LTNGLQSQVLGQYGETAAYIPPLLLSVLAEMRTASNEMGRLVDLPTWGRVSEMDARYLTHQWAKKVDKKLIPVPPAPAATPGVHVPAHAKGVSHASFPQPEAGPSRKRGAVDLASPPQKASKRPRTKTARRPTIALDEPKAGGPKRQGGKSKEILTDTGSESGEVDEEQAKQKGKGKSKGKSGKTPAKVSF